VKAPSLLPSTPNRQVPAVREIVAAQPRRATDPTATVVPKPRGVEAEALWDFEGGDPRDLPFKKGDVITITKQEGDWWTGWLNGKTGILPENRVRLLSPSKVLRKALEVSK